MIEIEYNGSFKLITDVCSQDFKNFNAINVTVRCTIPFVGSDSELEIEAIDFLKKNLGVEYIYPGPPYCKKDDMEAISELVFQIWNRP